jgi:hypothetical protein
MGVYRLPDNEGWFVESSTRPGIFWLVSWGEHPRHGKSSVMIRSATWFTCTCEAGQERRKMGPPPHARVCRHVTQAMQAERADGYEDRRTGPAHISALTD